jgi:hypothetical protein
LSFTDVFLWILSTSRSSNNNFLTHSAAAEAAAKTLAAAIALKFHPKHEKRKQKP